MATPPPRRRRTPPPQPRRHRPVPRAPRTSRGRRRLALLTAIPLLALLSLVVVRVVYTDRALPGTRLAGVAVEGDSRGALRARLERMAARAVTVYTAGERVPVTPAAAGYRLDVGATLRAVLDAGRRGAAFGAVQTAEGLVGSRDVRPVDRVDRARLRQASADVAARVGRTADPGGLVIDAAGGTVGIRAPRAGRTVDRAVLERELVAALRAGRHSVRAPLRPVPVAGTDAVRAVARAAERYLQAPLRLTGAGPAVTVDARRLAGILRLRASRPDLTRVRLGSDEAAVRTLIARLAGHRDRASREPRLDAAGRAVVLDGKGTVSWRPRRARVRVLRAGRTGFTIDQGAALTAVAAAIRTGSHAVRLPVARAVPKVTAAQARRIHTLIGTFTTRYEPGQPRVTNIRTMARTVDGTVIAPGAQFSLNTVVGERTKARGYVEAPFIGDGNRIVPSVGGGVSQFSTTMYNAAYFAGLRVDTHQPHSLYISRYPPGREATLDYPGIDLKWTNDTDLPILVRTFTDATSVTVSLYGENGGRRVTARPGPREKVPGGDFKITVTRTIRYPDGHTADDAFTSTYARGAE